MTNQATLSRKNRIDATFQALKRRKQKALIAFITAGDPNLKTTEMLALEFERRGVDCLELGYPFSDPVADGPTIQRASNRALRTGITLKALFQCTRRLRRKGLTVPLVLLSYYNPIFRFGERRFVTEAKRNGMDGVIVPDLPLEEAKALVSYGKKNRFHLIFMIAPTSDRIRRKKIIRTSGGFIYYVSVTGTTGIRKRLPKEVIQDVRALKRLTRIPICVGFGVSTPEAARKVSRVSDGVIVGSAIVQKLEKFGRTGSRRLKEKLGKYVSSFTKEVHR